MSPENSSGLSVGVKPNTHIEKCLMFIFKYSVIYCRQFVARQPATVGPIVPVELRSGHGLQDGRHRTHGAELRDATEYAERRRVCHSI